MKHKASSLTSGRIFLAGFLFLLLSVTGCNSGVSKKKNPYSLDIISSVKDYFQSTKLDSSNLMTDLEDYIPGILLDIRYADTNNFTGKKIYTLPKAYLRKPVADSLLKIQKILAEMNLGVKVYDAYRPYAATLYFYEVYGDTTFVAAPWKGSVHNRGCAVDLTLVNIETKEELPMPTTFDEFSPAAAHSFAQTDSVKNANRLLLLRIMTENGFEMYEHEWWHYNFKETKRFKLMDISFEKLEETGH